MTRLLYNIYQYLSELGEKVKVYRNDEISIDGLMKLKNMKAIVLSPGPGNPNDAGICLEVIQHIPQKSSYPWYLFGTSSYWAVFWWRGCEGKASTSW